MALYEFRADDGETIVLERSMNDSPKADYIMRKGKCYYRVWGAEVGRVEHDYRFISHQTPLNHPAAQDTDERGRARFSSKKELKDFEARAQHMGEDVVYDY